jgi:hypothetical protein
MLIKICLQSLAISLICTPAYFSELLKIKLCVKICHRVIFCVSFSGHNLDIFQWSLSLDSVYLEYSYSLTYIKQTTQNDVTIAFTGYVAWSCHYLKC